MHRPTRALLAVACAGALAGVAACSGAGGGAAARAARTWVQESQGPPPAVDPQLPGQSGEPGQPRLPQQTSPGGGSPSQQGQRGDSAVVATHLRVPWGLAVLPDGSALVGERPTGRIVRVLPQGGPVRQVMRINGLDTSGDGGLLGLALSPSYDEDRLVFAYVTTKTDNRVIRFTLGGRPQPILTGIPRGASDNGGRIGFGTDGDLYVGTGDAGRPALAASRTSLAGKILRITVFGKPARGNPDPDSPIYASGFRDVSGLCWDNHRRLYATDAGSGSDELDLVSPGAGYGWPRAGAGGRVTRPLLSWPKADGEPGGCAVIGFGMFVGELRGERVDAIPLGLRGRPNGRPDALLRKTYGRLRTVVADENGALWVTTSNRDGFGHPVPADDRVLRIEAPSSTTDSPV